jgi:hypothetical protein
MLHEPLFFSQTLFSIMTSIEKVKQVDSGTISRSQALTLLLSPVIHHFPRWSLLIGDFTLGQTM